MALHLIEKKPAERKKGSDLLEQARDSFIESAGKISANMLGMVNKAGGQIYSILFLSRSPMSLDEIGDALRLSKGNVSVNVRMLEECGLVRKVWVKGTRKDYYEAARDHPRKLLKDFFDRVREGIDNSLRLINQSRVKCEGAVKPLRGSDLEDAQFMISQLDLLAAFYSAASEMFENFYQGRAIDTDLLRRAILE